MNFMILIICFVVCNVFGHFHVFQYCEECLPLNAKPLSTFQYLYCKVKNLNFKISLNQHDKIFLFIKQRWVVLFSSICAGNMSSYGHSLVPKREVQVPKIANIDFFPPKPYLNGVDRDFLFDRKFCLV